LITQRLLGIGGGPAIGPDFVVAVVVAVVVVVIVLDSKSSNWYWGES
jgi:hypothetical protein